MFNRWDGFRIVKFEKAEDAQSAVSAMDEMVIPGNPSALKVKFDRGSRK